MDNSASAKTVFDRIFARGGWGSNESISGKGSEVGTTGVFRTEFGRWLDAHPEVRTILDAPCGDFNWIRLMPEIAGRNYIGGDIVEGLIARNRDIHGGPGRDFQVVDIIDGELPQADLWLCRDVLFHFPIDVAVRVTSRFTTAGIQYFLATTFPGRHNDRSAPMGGYAPYNLQAAPFELPAPVAMLSDPGEHPASGRKVGVWGVSSSR
jgi:SAM-dependent methyltransferase